MLMSKLSLNETFIYFRKFYPVSLQILPGGRAGTQPGIFVSHDIFAIIYSYNVSLNNIPFSSIPSPPQAFSPPFLILKL